MDINDLIYKMRGVDSSIKRAYVAQFNGANRERGDKILNDLIMRFHFYGAKPTTDPIQLAKNAAYREVIEYILTMSSRISDETLGEIEKFINS